MVVWPPASLTWAQHGQKGHAMSLSMVVWPPATMPWAQHGEKGDAVSLSMVVGLTPTMPQALECWYETCHEPQHGRMATSDLHMACLTWHGRWWPYAYTGLHTGTGLRSGTGLRTGLRPVYCPRV